MGTERTQGTLNEGVKVRLNVPEEAEHGQIGTVIGVTTSPYGRTVVWVTLPAGHAWAYQRNELEVVIDNKEGE